MKNDKKLFVLIELVLLTAVLILAFLMVWEKYGKDPAKVSVIIQNSEDEQWTAFKHGLKKAAEDKGIELFIVTTEGMLHGEEEKKTVENEINDGADAVIIQPALGTDTERELKRIQKKIPVLLAEPMYSQTDEIQGLPMAEPDNYGMGAALAKELLKDYNGKIEGKTFGIFSETEDSKAVAERKQGLTDGLEDAGAEISWSVSELFTKEGESLLEVQKKVDFVIALDDNSLTTAGKYSASNDLHGALIYGIGHSTEAAYYLDCGFAECVIVPDEFGVGYQSLIEMAESIENPFYEAEDQVVTYTVLRRETIFSKENQELLFIMSQ